MNWYFAAFKKYAVFDGRAQRMEFWVFQLINLLICAAYLFFHKVTFSAITSYVFIDDAFPIAGTSVEITRGFAEFLLLLPLLLFWLMTFIPSFAVTVRRLHDTGRSGGWVLISILPYVGYIILSFILVSDSQPGTNEYGPNPKAIPANDSVQG